MRLARRRRSQPRPARRHAPPLPAVAGQAARAAAAAGTVPRPQLRGHPLGLLQSPWSIGERNGFTGERERVESEKQSMGGRRDKMEISLPFYSIVLIVLNRDIS